MNLIANPLVFLYSNTDASAHSASGTGISNPFVFPLACASSAKTQTAHHGNGNCGSIGDGSSGTTAISTVSHDSTAGAASAGSASAETAIGNGSISSAAAGHSHAENAGAASLRLGRDPSLPCDSLGTAVSETSLHRQFQSRYPNEHTVIGGDTEHGAPNQSSSAHRNELITKCPPYRNSVISPLVLPIKSARIYQKRVIGGCAAGNGHSVTNSSAFSAGVRNKTVKNCGAASSGKCRKMVAMQEIISSSENNHRGYTGIDDSSEELPYGPGIVSKLRCRYLSLALRQTVSKQRPSIDNLRRATSLNNLLDDDDDEDDESEDGDEIGNMVDDDEEIEHYEDDASSKNSWNSHQPQSNGIGGGGYGIYNRSHMTNGSGDHRLISEREYQQKYTDNRRAIGRGNDSLKRARSVEALVRYDNRAWRRDIIKDSVEYASHNPIIVNDELIVNDHHPPLHATGHLITIEDKIQSSRQRRDIARPKRLTSFMDETERPPPDLVKQTLLKFEATCNRKPPTRYPNGDVAAKVATYKGIMGHDKRPPLSASVAGPKPMKPMAKPHTTSPKPVIAFANVTVAREEHRATAKHGGVYNGPSLDVHTIRQNLERANRTIPNGLYHGASSAPLSAIRVDTSGAYRHNTSPPSPNLLSPGLASSPRSPRLPLSPSRMPALSHHKAAKSASEVDAVHISQLAKKSDGLHIASPRPTVTIVNATPHNQMGQRPTLKSNFVVYDSDGEEHSSSSEAESTDGSSDYAARNGKRSVSKSALENIAKAGTTTKYQFEAMTNGTAAASNGAHLHLPTAAFAKRNGPSTAGESHQTAEPNVRQIGIIRPLVAEPKQPSRSTLMHSNNYSNYTNGSAVKSNDGQIEAAKMQPATQVMSSAAAQSHRANVSDSDDKTKTDTYSMGDSKPIIVAIQASTSLSLREIQKNQINREKSDSSDGQQQQQPTAVQSPKRISNKRAAASNGQASHQPNSMVFNFKHRKDVPDYIENDGLVIRRKREMPKVS